jgi:uncharacterized protein (DUF2147 family)
MIKPFFVRALAVVALATAIDLTPGSSLVLPAAAQTQAPKRAAPPPAPPVPANPYAGLWLDHTGDGVVELASCAPDTPDRLCGRIVWLRQPIDPQGRPFVDGLNEDATQRGRPICGLPIIVNVVAKPDGTYDDGAIYDPRQGKAFNVSLSLLAPDRMQVMGYKGVKLFNRKFVWTKIADLPARCQVPRV